MLCFSKKKKFVPRAPSYHVVQVVVLEDRNGMQCHQICHVYLQKSKQPFCFKIIYKKNIHLIIHEYEMYFISSKHRVTCVWVKISSG